MVLLMISLPQDILSSAPSTLSDKHHFLNPIVMKSGGTSNQVLLYHHLSSASSGLLVFPVGVMGSLQTGFIPHTNDTFDHCMVC